MSCIKFPSSKSELIKMSNKENLNDYASVNSQLISIANQVFGQGNWSHAITNQTLDFIDNVAGKYQAGCASIVRVQLNNGIFHENVGYSSTEGSSKGSAIQRARLGSYNTALKKTLMAFGNEVTLKINGSSSRPTSLLPMEPVPSKPNPNEASTSTVKDKSEVEPFSESIPLSQTDALMDIVDLDQIFAKDQKSDNATTVNKETNEDISKLSLPTGVLTEQDKSSNNLNITSKKDDAYKASESIGVSNSNDKDNKFNNTNGLKKENKIEAIKPVVSTVMTEEEMRLERKRKQREMQEEFKRKEEYKRKHGENGTSKQPPNPRY